MRGRTDTVVHFAASHVCGDRGPAVRLGFLTGSEHGWHQRRAAMRTCLRVVGCVLLEPVRKGTVRQRGIRRVHALAFQTDERTWAAGAVTARVIRNHAAPGKL